jgi:hypothetical protein
LLRFKKILFSSKYKKCQIWLICTFLRSNGNPKKEDHF